MSVVLPFAALRPDPRRAAEIAAVPYDVVTTEEARQLAAGNPVSFLHVSRPEIDLPEGTDPHSDAVYAKAVENLARLEREGPLVREPEPALYLYRLRMGEHEQTGIAGAFSVDEYDTDRIRKHERTRRDKEDDRTRHMVALRAQTGPVFLTFRGLLELDSIVAEERRRKPLYDFTAEDGVAHTVWKLGADESRRLSEAFDAVPLLYVADGHHRAASASRARDEFAMRADRAGGGAAYDFFLAVAFPSDQVRILPYNRTVRGLGGRTPERFLDELRSSVPVSEGASPSPARRGEASIYLDRRWYGIRLAPDGSASDALDVTLLQERVLEPILGIRDVRTDERIEFVGGARGTDALERKVDSGEAAVAFSVYPVSVDDLMRIADAREIMPPKSTWFEPKLRDGLLSHVI